MKQVIKIAKTVRTVVKYAGLILVIFDIIAYACQKLEKYAVDKDPKLKGELDADQRKDYEAPTIKEKE